MPRANDNERWEPIGEGALQTTPSELVRWADNYRKPHVGGPRLVAAQLGRRSVGIDLAEEYLALARERTQSL